MERRLFRVRKKIFSNEIVFTWVKHKVSDTSLPSVIRLSKNRDQKITRQSCSTGQSVSITQLDPANKNPSGKPLYPEELRAFVGACLFIEENVDNNMAFAGPGTLSEVCTNEESRYRVRDNCFHKCIKGMRQKQGHTCLLAVSVTSRQRDICQAATYNFKLDLYLLQIRKEPYDQDNNRGIILYNFNSTT